MMAPGSFHEWLAGRVRQTLARTGPTAADPLVRSRAEWRQLLALAWTRPAASCGAGRITSYCSVSVCGALREAARGVAAVSRRPSRFWSVRAPGGGSARNAAGERTGRIRCGPAVDDERQLEPLLASYVEERFDHPKAAWKDLTLGHAESTLVGAGDVLEYLAVPSRDLGQLETEGKFPLSRASRPAISACRRHRRRIRRSGGSRRWRGCCARKRWREIRGAPAEASGSYPKARHERTR